ncbi:MAG: flagellar biosynthesis protein FlhF, partial [Gammaproteobacteria bacterium]|nr:flagellar biosynthesis protein FlhF [Gammaproteobacteria bacterium]
MKIKRYFAETVRQAIGKVRDELGPDAVILSNRRNDDGVEIVVAIDYDESMLTETSGGDSVSSQQVASEQQVLPSARSQFASPPISKPASNTHSQSSSQSRPHAVNPSASSYESLSRERLASNFDNGSRDRYVQPRVTTEGRAPVLSIAAMQQEIQSLRTLIEAGFNKLSDASADLPDTEIFQRLSRLGLTVPLCHALVEKVSGISDIDGQWSKALAHLSAQIPVTEDDIISSGGVVALVGPTGVGKTTTVAKLAARYMLRHGPRRVALVTTDNYRIGAHEQLRTYGRILDVPVRVVADQAELYSTLKEWSDKQL